METFVPTPGTNAGVQLEAVFQLPAAADAQTVCASVFVHPKPITNAITSWVLKKMTAIFINILVDVMGFTRCFPER
jgi:hypothetical protein